MLRWRDGAGPDQDLTAVLWIARRILQPGAALFISNRFLHSRGGPRVKRTVEIKEQWKLWWPYSIMVQCGRLLHVFLYLSDLASVLRRRAGTVPAVAMLGILALLCVLFLTPLLQIRPNSPLFPF